MNVFAARHLGTESNGGTFLQTSRSLPSPAFLARMQRNQNALGPVCVRLCESERVYLTSQLAVMTHRRLYLWQKSSLFARHSGSSWFIEGQTAAQRDSGTFVDVTCVRVCIKQRIVILPTFLCDGWTTEFKLTASYVCLSILPFSSVQIYFPYSISKVDQLFDLAATVSSKIWVVSLEPNSWLVFVTHLIVEIGTKLNSLPRARSCPQGKIKNRGFIETHK